MTAQRRKAAIAAGLVAVILLQLGWLALDRRAASWLAAYDETWRKDLEAERTLAAGGRVPVLRGAALDDDAHLREQALFLAHEFDVIEYAQVSSAVDAAALAPIGSEALAVLARRRDEVAALREATRCSRCVATPDYESGPEMRPPDVVRVRGLVNLLLLEGRAAAVAGDVAGAAACYLDAVRVGVDVATNQPLYDVVLGTVVCEHALVALGRLVTQTDGLPLDAIAGELARLEPSLPSARSGLRCERLTLGAWRRIENEDRLLQVLGCTSSDVAFPGRILPRRHLVAQAIPEIEELLSELVRAAATDDPAERAKIEAAVDERAGRSSNVLVRVFVSHCTGVRAITDRAVARLRLVQAAIAAEKARAAGSAPVMPDDPFGGKIRYEATPRGYRVSSAGKAGGDPGLESTPLALEREAR